MELRNKAEWHSAGFVPKRGELPHQTVSLGRGRYATLYRDDQVRPLAKRTTRPTVALDNTPENVLAACWTVNRTAKRYRDAASACFQSGAYSFATANKHRKLDLYTLKDRAIAWLHDEGHLQPEGKHGGLCLYVGSGYSFHSTLAPKGVELDGADTVWRAEAKPRAKAEMRLKDAEALLRKLDDRSQNGHYTRLEPPRVARPVRVRDWDDDWDDGWDDDEDDDEDYAA